MEKYIHKVMYYETDKMGITHHSNYIRWMEEARIDLFDKTGLSYRMLESSGIYSPVVSIECSFRSPTTFEDEVGIEVWIEEFRGVKLILGYRMINSGSGETVFTGRSVHCFSDKTGKPIRLKRSYPELDEKLRSISGQQRDT